MSSSVRQWTLVALVKKTFLHFDWRQLADWRKQVTTWRDLRGLLYSHSDIVCLLIQSNCIELQPSINILIWVAWLFDHPVHTQPYIQTHTYHIYIHYFHTYIHRSTYIQPVINKSPFFYFGSRCMACYTHIHTHTHTHTHIYIYIYIYIHDLHRVK
jgi:hypothetical protein